MRTPFDSAYAKLAWGRKRIAELQRETDDFLRDSPCESIAEPHPDKSGYRVQKIRLIRPLPDKFSLIAGDAVDNLRAALDHATFAVASAAGNQAPRNAYFPFAASVDRLEDSLKGRCKDLPQEIYPLLRTFKPYEGGNQILVALNKACNRNKHALLLSFSGVAAIVAANFCGTEGFISIPTRHVWDRTKNEMDLFIEGPGAKRDGYFYVRFLITLSEIPGFGAEQAFLVLTVFADEVNRVLLAVETEARNLGLCQ